MAASHPGTPRRTSALRVRGARMWGSRPQAARTAGANGLGGLQPLSLALALRTRRDTRRCSRPLAAAWKASRSHGRQGLAVLAPVALRHRGISRPRHAQWKGCMDASLSCSSGLAGAERPLEEAAVRQRDN